jgi:glycosyltransferase involved in cell wall biosynthesis
MIRVLQVIPTLDRSGAEKQMVLLAAGLPRDRFAVEVAALTRLGPLEGALREAGVPVTLVGKRGKLDLFALRRLAGLMKAGRFDVVNTWIFAANVYGRIAARMAGVPVVVTSEMAVDLWKRPAELRVDRWLARWTTRVVGNSDAVVRFYREAGVPEGKLERIYSGIGPEGPVTRGRGAVRAELATPDDAPVLLFVGRLAPQKGVDVLLRALDLLQHVEPRVVTWVAGEGPERARLEATARAFTLLPEGRVRFVGHREDVPDLIEAADVLVLPSRYEGLPNVVLEAMQRSRPVVATAAPGTDEVVEGGVTGVLVPVDDAQALARELRDLVRDPARRVRLGEAGRERAGREFGLDAMIGGYAELYERLAGVSGRSPVRAPGR